MSRRAPPSSSALARAVSAAAALALAAGIADGQPAPAGQPAASAPAPVSEAEHLVFVQQHLANVEAPRTLRYRYVREGGGSARLEDDVTMALERAADGSCCAVHGEYLTGANAMPLPDIDSARANPVVLFFLEQQIRDLQRRTGGTINHFRQRIRLALANAAQVSTTTVRWDGRDVPARTVRIAPYADDPYRSRFEKDADTEYSFVLADAIPGGVWQLRAAGPREGALAQTVTFRDAVARPANRR